MARKVITVSNPPNRFDPNVLIRDEPAGETGVVVLRERAKSILSENDSPDVPFRFSLNPYRGCYHGCAYCYARTSHQNWGFGAGTDFDRKIIVKTNAVELLSDAFAKPSWNGEHIVFSGNTDCYQPLEASFRLTRGCLELCAEHANPVSIITKGTLVTRDIDVLQTLARDAAARVNVSIAFANDNDAAKIEPGAPTITRRFRIIEELSRAGIPVAVSLAPVMPGLNDMAIPEILRRAASAGATGAFLSIVRLPREVNVVFEERLREQFPLRADKVLRAIEDMKGGVRNRSAFGDRMRGEGERWNSVTAMFETFCDKYGLVTRFPGDSATVNTFRRKGQQLRLL